MTQAPSNRRAWISAGIALSAVALLSNAPYSALIALFDYDDVLRRPAREVLQAFQAGGTELVMAWWGLGLCAVGFSGAAALLGEALKQDKHGLSGAVTMFGVMSGVLQALALFRWTFMIPPLAAAHASAAVGATDGAAEQAAIETTYAAMNAFAGVGIGEHLGQILLIIWTCGVGLAVMRLGGAMGWIGAAGLATLPFWIVGQTELLATAIPELPVIEVIPYAYMAWEAWLLVLGVAMIVRAARGKASVGAANA